MNVTRAGRLTVIATVAAVAVAPGAWAGTSAASKAPHYRYSILKVHVHAKTCGKTIANGINDAGKVVATEYCGKAKAVFISASGHKRVYTLPKKKKERYTYGSNISSNGIIALDGSRTASGYETGWLRSRSGHLTKIHVPHSYHGGTVVNGVNASGQAVGYFCQSKHCDVLAPFLYDSASGSYEAIGISISSGSAYDVTASNITNKGTIAGYYFDQNGRYHGFILRNGVTHHIEAPHAGKKLGQGTEIFDIANDGSYCGIVTKSHGRIRGFIHRHGGHYREFSLGGGGKKAFTQILAINRHGEIGGSHYSGAKHSYPGFLGRLS